MLRLSQTNDTAGCMLAQNHRDKQKLRLSRKIRQRTQETTGSRKISVLLAWGLAEIIETGLNNLVSHVLQFLLELTNYQTRLPLIGNRNKHN